jgi:hypothetical protein
VICETERGRTIKRLIPSDLCSYCVICRAVWIMRCVGYTVYFKNEWKCFLFVSIEYTFWKRVLLFFKPDFRSLQTHLIVSNTDHTAQVLLQKLSLNFVKILPYWTIFSPLSLQGKARLVRSPLRDCDCVSVSPPVSVFRMIIWINSCYSCYPEQR